MQQFDLGKAFQTGRQGLQLLNYGEDRQIAADQRQRQNERQDFSLQNQYQAMQQKQQAAQEAKDAAAQKDMYSIFSTIKPDDPEIDKKLNMAAPWIKQRNPHIIEDVDQFMALPIEEKKFQMQTIRSQMGIDKATDEFVRGKPFVNAENERVVPIYDKATQKLVRTEKLGDEQEKDLPVITWTDEQKRFLAEKYIATGEKPMKTRGKEANYLNQVIEQLAAKIQLEGGVGGAETAFLQKDRKAIQSSIAAQEKQRGSMVSFVANLSDQVDHVKDIAAEINTFDARFMNKPLRWVKKKLKGDPQLSKYEVYLGEIQSEIGKLSSGSTASVAELSQGAREKWESILDENLSINDMVQILEEVKEAGNIRMESVDTGLRTSRAMLRKVGQDKPGTKKEEKQKPKYQEGQTANGGKLIFSGGVWKDNI